MAPGNKKNTDNKKQISLANESKNREQKNFSARDSACGAAQPKRTTNSGGPRKTN